MSERVPKALLRAVDKVVKPTATVLEFDDIFLERCPFCDGPARFEQVDRAGYISWTVNCDNQDVDCIAASMFSCYSRKIEAADAWNMRGGKRRR